MRRLYNRAKRGYVWERDHTDFTPAMRAGFYVLIVGVMVAIQLQLGATRETWTFTAVFAAMCVVFWFVMLLLNATWADINEDDKTFDG